MRFFCRLRPQCRRAVCPPVGLWPEPGLFTTTRTWGGDCTNFASQCVFAGSGVMNFTPDFGWYYIDANQKSPSWTGVPYFWNFMTRQAPSVGPVAQPCALEDLQPGDLVQLSFNGQEFQHTPVVVRVTAPITLETVLIAAHSYDADNRPLSTYTFQDIRFLHVLGTIRP